MSRADARQSVLAPDSQWSETTTMEMRLVPLNGVWHTRLDGESGHGARPVY